MPGLLRAGRGGLSLVIGEAGIGKTWLAAETARTARALGTGVAWSACWEGDGAPAFWPWIQLLRELGAAAVVELLVSGGDDRPIEPAAQRVRLVEAVDGVLRGAGPLLLYAWYPPLWRAARAGSPAGTPTRPRCSTRPRPPGSGLAAAMPGCWSVSRAGSVSSRTATVTPSTG